MLLVRFVQFLQKLFQKYFIQIQHTLLLTVVRMAQVPPIANGCDFGHVLELEQLQSVAKVGNEAKFIAMIFSDAGPDENPRFPKTLDLSVQHFTKHKFDALLVSTHGPGMSVYNQVERRMGPLTKDLAGFILPYDTFANHLDSQKRTVDEGLENRNFKRTGEVLAEAWNELVLDN